MIKRLFLLSLFISLCVNHASGQIDLINFSSGYTLPVDIKNCGDDRLFILEQRGVISIADTGGVKYAQPFLNIVSKVQLSSEQGLLGLAFPPDFKTSGYFYINYTSKPSGTTTISRFHVDPATPDSADPNSEEILLTIYQPFSNHNGGHLAFGPDGYLYIGTGDGGSAGDPGNRAQNKDSLLGKMLRIEVVPGIPTYNIPPTNPYANGTQGRPEIWAIGMRNPWRWSFDPLTGDLWIGDVGQNLIEEVDFQPAGSPGGLNYGWRCYEANAVYSGGGNCPAYSQTVAPVFQYNHSPYCSVTGGYIYRGARYQELYGKYFFTDYCRSEMRYLEANGSGGFNNVNLGILGGSAAISTFGVDRHGEIYCAGVNSGIIYRMISQNCAPVATINTGEDTLDDCSSGQVQLSVPFDSSYQYLWMLNGDTVSTSSALSATLGGKYFVYVTNQTCTNSDSVTVVLTAPLTINITGLDTLYCVYNPLVNLVPNYIPGVFNGPGINGATFDPAVAGIGSHVVTYTYTSPAGCVYVHTQPVRVDACLNVPENLWTNTIKISPNPSQNNFYIRAFTPLQKKIKMEITDVAGRKIMMEEMVLSIGENKIPVHSALAKGVYTARFFDEISSASLKMIIQ